MTLKYTLELSAKETLSDYVTAIAWSPTGNTLAAASGAGEVRLLKNFVSLSLCQPTGQSVDALAFSFDGKWLAAGGQEGVITLWQMEGDVPEIADTLECGSWVDRLVWHPTCNRLAFNRGKAVQIWDADRAEAVTSLAGIASPQDIRWSPDGKHLWVGAIVAMDNLPVHYATIATNLIESVGAKVKFLPPYSPDLSPIELCWSKLKEIIRSAKARTIEALDEAITNAINGITDENALNWFQHCALYFEPFR
jgi:WD40 repeat protein